MGAIDQIWAARCKQNQNQSGLFNPYQDGDTPLLTCLLLDDLSGATRLLADGATVHMLEAVLLNDVPTLTTQLAQGASAWLKSELGWTALHLAAFRGHAECIPLLLQAGLPADLRARSPGTYEGCTPLQLAVVCGSEAATRVLLKAGADPGLIDEAGWTPLHHAAHEGKRVIAKALIIAGAPVNALCGDTTPYGLAKRKGHAQVAALLRQVGGSD
ncbi:MAG: hypothetical protein GWP91_11525 [Rhodobacterales bacterium]|nr:hypothetical protein [Rhodobacterales bacterium]